jgi:O-methyltransferase/aklanonic acid methyltransferase
VSNNRTAEIFSRIAPDFDRVGPSFFSQSGRRLVELLNPPPGSRVLDVACGRGAALFPLAEKVGTWGQVFGMDLADGMIRHTHSDIRRCELKTIHLSRMDATQLALASSSFDCVLCSQSIVYFPQALGEFHRVLKPGGKTALSTIASGCFGWMMDIFSRYESPDDESDEENETEHFTLDTSAGMESALREVGFVEVQIHAETSDMLYHNEETWWQMLWTLGFRGALEAMLLETQAKFKADLFQELQGFKQADGFHIPFKSLFATCIRPDV